MESKIDAQKRAGAEFLQVNKNKEGVVVLPEGIQYEVVKQGNGPKPAPNATIKAH